MSTGNGTIPALAAVATFAATGGNIYAAQGAYMVASYLDPIQGPTQEGPRLSDLSQQTSTYGAFIPRLYGTVAVNGNIFWLEHNKLKEVVKKKKTGGKGGGSSATTKTYSYFATLAIGVCEGPVDGIRRIWAGPNLVYDAGADDIDSIIQSNLNKSNNFEFFLGGASQLASSRMQADLGVANTPAYAGLCYVVIKDFALAKYGNAIPQFKIEVVKKASYNDSIMSQSRTVIPHWNSGVATGNPLDARGWSNYVLNAARFDPVYLVSIRPDGSEIKTLYTPPFNLGDVWPVNPICCNLRNMHFAFLGSAYVSNPAWDSVHFGTASRMYGYNGLPANSKPCAIIEIASDEIFLIRGNSAPYTLDRIKGDPSGNSALVSSITLPAGFTPAAACDGAYLYLADFGTVTGQVAVRVYSLDMVLVDSWTVTGTGTTLNYTTGCPATIRDGVMTVMSYPDGSTFVDRAEFPRITLSSKSVDLKILPEPTGCSVPLTGCLHDLGGVYVWSQRTVGSYDLLQVKWKYTAQSEVSTSLQEIISAECALTGLLSGSDIDVTSLTDTATGYRIGKIGSIRNSIEPLQGIWPFDVVQSGYKIKFRKRGQASIAAVSIGDLGVDEQLKQSREMDSQLPTSIVANYLDRGRNYDGNQQPWERPSTGSVNTRTMDIPAVLTATQAAQVVERLGYLYWLERTEFGPFTLPPTFCQLEPADVITLDAGYAEYELRLTSVNYKSDGSIECVAKPNSASTYTSLAAANDVPDSAVIGRPGPTSMLLLDIPVVDETTQNAPSMIGMMCGYTAAWSAGAIWRSADSGQTWDDIQALSGAATMGVARAALLAHAGNIIDRGNTLTIDLLAGSLSGVTEAQMLNGANIAAYGAHGRWEILRFQNASLNADGSYTISGLWRGDKGTEWATGLHLYGDSFALLNDPDGAVISMPQELIGAARIYRGITAGESIDTDDDHVFTYSGANLECLSPCQATGSRSSGDLTIKWQRRTRVGGAWRDKVDASLSEVSEAYEIDVMSGSTVKRTISASTNTATYTSAQQVADFGSAQASITVRIYQLSSVVGRGYPLEAII